MDRLHSDIELHTAVAFQIVKKCTKRSDGAGAKASRAEVRVSTEAVGLSVNQNV